MKKIFLLLAIIVASSSFLNLKADSPRKVLYEKFTNASCGPCAAQDPYYKGFLANPANKSILIPISYHVNFPGRDVINELNPIIPNSKRGYYNITGVPAGRANGIIHPASPQWYAGAPGDTASIAGILNNIKGTISPVDIELSQSTNNREITANVKISTSTSLIGKNLHIAFIERTFPHPNAGSNGQTEFEYVVREMLVDNARSGTGKVLNLNAGQDITITEKWTVPSQIDLNQIYIVAFVQDNITKEVLQAGMNLEESPSMIVSSTDTKYSLVDRNGSSSKNISVTNPTTNPVSISLSLDNSYGELHPDAEVNFSMQTFDLAPSETKQITITLNNGIKGGYSGVGVKTSTLGKISKPLISEFGFLSKGTKYVVYTGFPGFNQEAFSGISKNPDYSDEIAFIPIASGNQYFPTEKEFLPESFDVTIFALGTYPLAVNNNPHNVAALAKTLLDAGKHVYISSTDGMYYTFNPTAAGQVGNPPSSLNFYQTMLGLQYQDRVARNDGQYYTLFTINGVMNDPIGKGSTVSSNNYNQTNQDLSAYQSSAFTDVFTLNSNSRAIPCFYYNNVQNDLAGVRYRNPSNNARLVYTTFTIEAIGSKINRDVTMKNIMDWLVNDSPTSVATTVETGVSLMPNPASIFSTINFQSTSNQTVTISVIDVQGKVVLMNEISAPTVGSNSYSLMTSKLTNGSYTVVVKQGENVSRTPLVIMN